MVLAVTRGMGSRRVIVKPGQSWGMNRRSTRRYYLFRPDVLRELEQCFWYCLAYAAGKYGILVHAAVLMSTHVHYVITDPRGNRPRFKQEFHRLFALCVKSILGWPEEVFNKSKTGEHEVLGPAGMIDHIAYIIANPVLAFAVRYVTDWPGAKTLPGEIGTRVIRVKRPKHYFRGSQWPDELELELTMPSELEAEYGADEARKRIAEAVKLKETEALAESRAKGIPFQGRRKLLRQHHTRRARSYEVFGSCNPKWIAAGDHERASRAKSERLAFESEYDGALAGWRSGDRTVVFPFGTWWMRVHHGARCRPPP